MSFATLSEWQRLFRQPMVYGWRWMGRSETEYLRKVLFNPTLPQTWPKNGKGDPRPSDSFLRHAARGSAAKCNPLAASQGFGDPLTKFAVLDGATGNASALPVAANALYIPILNATFLPGPTPCAVGRPGSL